MENKFKRFYVFLLMMVLSMGFITAQSVTVSGTVVDVNGEPLIGASVIVVNTTIGTITDLDGKFAVKTEVGANLKCSYIGYMTEKQTVVGSTMDFILKNDLLSLDEVIVTGQSGLTTKKQLGSTINSVKSEDLGSGASSSITEALQGRLSGAQIMRNSGSPSSSISIRLRGASTILGSSDPLIMIDGVIVNGDARSAVSLGSYKQNPLVDIDMNDIERMEILKGAAAAALYGSLASNGIIQIFTKKGKIGKPRISVSSSLNFNSVLKFKPYNDVNKKWVEDPDNAGSYITEDATRYNYQDYFFQKSTGYENHINVSGGNEKTTYSFSGSMLDNGGILKNTSFNRKTFRIRLDQMLTNWLTMSVGNYTSFNKSKEIPFANAWTGNPMVSLLFGDNSVDLTPDEDGKYPDNGWMSNAYEDVDLLDIYQKNTRNISDVQLKAHFFDGLSLNYTFGYDYTSSEGKFKIPFGFTRDSKGDLVKSNLSSNILNSSINGSYKYGVNSFIKGTTGAGYSYQKKNYASVRLRSDKISEFDDIDIISGEVTGGSSLKEISYWGGYLQQHFAIHDKLFLTLAGRVDGSSTFGAKERQQFYPKVSAAYSLSDESFWQNSIGSVIDVFKLRAAWGQAGNLTALDQRPYGIYYNYGIGSYDGSNSYYPSSVSGNIELRPERQTEFELGLDMSLLANRLGLEFTYYNQKVEDLLLNRNLSPSTGYNSRLENVGSLTNTGVEIAANAVIIDSKDLKWNMKATFSKNVNKVTHVEGGRISLGGFSTSIAQTDQPLGVFYGFFFARKGGELVLDANGIPQRALGHYDTQKTSDGETVTVAVQDFDDNGQPVGEKLKKILGDPNPDFLASFTNEVTYKNFTLRAHFDAVQGFDVMDWDKRIALRYPGGYFYGQELKGEKPKGYYGSQYYIYEGFTEDGSFIKLRELSLAYDLKLNSPYIRSIRFILSGSNILNISKYWGYDSEVNFEGASNGARGQDFGNIPIPKVYKVGVKFNF